MPAVNLKNAETFFCKLELNETTVYSQASTSNIQQVFRASRGGDHFLLYQIRKGKFSSVSDHFDASSARGRDFLVVSN